MFFFPILFKLYCDCLFKDERSDAWIVTQRINMECNVLVMTSNKSAPARGT